MNLLLAQFKIGSNTLASLDGNGGGASEINEAVNSLRERMRRSMHTYGDKESIRAGRFVNLVLRKDTAEFHVDKSLMNLFQTTAQEKMHRLEFVHQ